jgi:hypothetical protein
VLAFEVAFTVRGAPGATTKDHVSDKLLVPSKPPKRMALLVTVSYANEDRYRAEGVEAGDGEFQYVPFQTHVAELVLVPSKPPKRTISLLAASKTIGAPYRAGGLATDCLVQAAPSHVHVSPRAPLDPSPPKRTTFRVTLSYAIDCS